MTAGEIFEKLQHYSNWKDLDLAVRKYDDGQVSPYVTDQARAEIAADILTKFNKSQSLVEKISNSVRVWIKNQKLRIAQYRKQKLESELALSRKCAKCKSRDCIWMSGYCPN